MSEFSFDAYVSKRESGALGGMAEETRYAFGPDLTMLRGFDKFRPLKLVVASLVRGQKHLFQHRFIANSLKVGPRQLPQVHALAAEHAQHPSLTPIELDRLRTLFREHLDGPRRADALAWLDAREHLDRGERPAPESAVHAAALAAQSALERGAPPTGTTPDALALAVVALHGEREAQREPLLRLADHEGLVATTEPTPKKAPWAKEATTRPIISVA